MHNEPNDGSHISTIVATTTCKKHKAGNDEPCWHVYVAFSRRFAPAVCGARIKRAGFTGKISPSSLSLKSPGGRPNKTRRW